MDQTLLNPKPNSRGPGARRSENAGLENLGVEAGSWDCLVATGRLSGKGVGGELWEKWLGVGPDPGPGASGSWGLPSAGRWPESAHRGQWS